MQNQDLGTATLNPPLRSFFTQKQWLLYSVVVLIGLAFRWYGLDLRPVHHDESLHLYYGRNFFENPETNFYKYDPMLHGPFLYNLLRLGFSLFGPTTWGGRAIIDLIGSAFIFAPLLFRRYLSPGALIGLTTAVALSPTLIYWSRFCREDVPVIAALIVMLYAAVVAPRARAWCYALIALSFQLVMKENLIVTIAILFGFFAYEIIFNLITRRAENTLLGDGFRNFKRFPWHATLGLALGVLVFFYFYSEGFRFNQGPLDFFSKSFHYWFEQHAAERIKGPFNFHLYVFTWYELPFVLGCGVALSYFYTHANNVLRLLGLLSIAAGVICAFYSANVKFEESPLWTLVKVKDSLDVVGLFVMVSHALLLTTNHLLRRERALAFWAYLFTASLFTYSYLGEKVPWLSLYAFIPGLIYLALLFDKLMDSTRIESWKSVPVERVLTIIGSALGILGLIFCLEEGFTADNLFFFGSGAAIVTLGTLNFLPGLLGRINVIKFIFVVFVLWSIRQAYLSNVLYAGNSREYLSQVHTTEEFQTAMFGIQHEMDFAQNGTPARVCVSGDASWPAVWYFYNQPNYRFREKNTPDACAGFEYQLVDFTGQPGDVIAGYKGMDLKLRGWWVPDFKQATLKKMLRYSLNRTPWGDSGYSYVKFLALQQKQ